MKRIGILTAGGDTPALNATIHGAVTRANQLKVEIIGLIKGFNCLFNPRVPHVHLNPLFQKIPELDPTKGGTLIGSSRDFVDPNKNRGPGHGCVAPEKTRHRGTDLHRRRRHVERPATACGTLADGAGAQDHRQRPGPELPERTGRMGARQRRGRQARLSLQTHGVATRFSISTKSSIMSRPAMPPPFLFPPEASNGFAPRRKAIAASPSSKSWAGIPATSRSASAYGQPDIMLVPEIALDLERLVERVKQLYDLQKNVVIVCGEGIVDEQGRELGAETKSTDPAGNMVLSGAAEALRAKLIQMIGDKLFPALPPRRIRQGSDLHPQSRPHPARRPAHSLRPILRRAARREGG